MCVIYLAGGCFWGMEKAFQMLEGVTETQTGYANGTVDHPSYETVCTGTTGHRETVKVVYDPSVISLETILKAYFICINPAQGDGQGHDIGEQYHTGIYTADEESMASVREYTERKRKLYPAFYTEVGMLKCFWPAEEYHQKYLEKNPGGYCHIGRTEFSRIRELNEKGKSL